MNALRCGTGTMSLSGVLSLLFITVINLYCFILLNPSITCVSIRFDDVLVCRFFSPSLVNYESFETETNLIQCKIESRFSIRPKHIHTHICTWDDDNAGPILWNSLPPTGYSNMFGVVWRIWLSLCHTKFNVFICAKRLTPYRWHALFQKFLKVRYWPGWMNVCMFKMIIRLSHWIRCKRARAPRTIHTIASHQKCQPLFNHRSYITLTN